MDNNVQEKLEKIGSRFENILQKNFLARDTKGKSEVEGSAGIFGQMTSKVCPNCYAYYTEERKKREAILKDIANGVENKLRNWECSS